MRRLLLLRHAKSAWDQPGLPDAERALDARGREAAPRMGRYMAAQGLLPDAVLVSSALRTRQTWGLIAPEWPRAPDVRLEPRLYEADPRTILGIIREMLESAPTLLLVGHNPGLQLTALDLARRDRTPSRRRLETKYPTAGLAVLDSDIEDWGDLSADTCVLERFVTPASIGAAEVDD